ncbi:MAG: hypothetical protein K5884_03185 [Ruminococcus sp.]|nr:hypothetical protein [Ruminococcus sp.]
MLKNKLFAAALTGAVMTSSVPAQSFAEETTVHTVTIIGFDGKAVSTVKVNDGEKLDLSGFDTSVFSSHSDKYTEIGFGSWSSYPEKITEDISVYALYTKRTISLDSTPVKNEYALKTGSIDLTGLEVSITSFTQLPEKDESGNFKVKEEKVNIEELCTTEPKNIDEAFANSTKADVSVYPIDSKIPIYTYTIEYYPYLGDVNMDGKVNSSDASEVLTFYSILSTGASPNFKSDQKRRCNVDHNRTIDSKDATEILLYYSRVSTGGSAEWEAKK